MSKSLDRQRHQQRDLVADGRDCILDETDYWSDYSGDSGDWYAFDDDAFVEDDPEICIARADEYTLIHNKEKRDKLLAKAALQFKMQIDRFAQQKQQRLQRKLASNPFLMLDEDGFVEETPQITVNDLLPRTPDHLLLRIAKLLPNSSSFACVSRRFNIVSQHLHEEEESEPLPTLPDEIILHILHFVSPLYLHDCAARVCRWLHRWYHYDFPWKQFFLSHSDWRVRPNETWQQMVILHLRYFEKAQWMLDAMAPHDPDSVDLLRMGSEIDSSIRRSPAALAERCLSVWCRSEFSQLLTYPQDYDDGHRYHPYNNFAGILDLSRGQFRRSKQKFTATGICHVCDRELGGWVAFNIIKSPSSLRVEVFSCGHFFGAAFMRDKSGDTIEYPRIRF
eukprot:TRINITY_DN13294_c0_g1_i1.p1 TRINITY_DN13294_c0_g1~~TRINITY_DN13294_c0_g1_i1.p1  ORF type:complete len:393 (+),score=69.03 TRINITY_DN13294_c0_g1_i1:56-1234(+)